jgi:hypothetical protein
MRRLMRNKRGIAEEISDTAFALLILFIGISLMTYISSLNKADRENKGASFMGQAIFENAIGVYLKEPVTIDGQTISMTDLIVLAAESKSTTSDYSKLWKQKTDAFFNSIADNLNTYAVDIDLSLEGKHLMDAGFGSYVERKPGYFSIIYLPSHSGKIITVDIAWTQHIQSYQVKPRGGP